MLPSVWLITPENALVALTADAHWPCDVLAEAPIGAAKGLNPGRAFLGQKIRPHRGGAGAVRAVGHRDRLVRKIRARIQRDQRRVIPFGDLAGEDLAQRVTVELQAGLDT